MINDVQIVWRGIMHDGTGYSSASRGYALALDRAGLDVKIEAMNFGTPPTELPYMVAKRINELIEKPYAKDKKKVLIYHAQPFGVDPIAEREKFDYVIINTVWETTKIPNNWFPNVNQADAVFVPSKQNVEALINSGVKVPIYCVPHGSYPSEFNPNNEPLKLPPVEDKFVFLSVFQYQHRKAPEVLFRAFWEEFTKEDNVALVVKTYWGDACNRVEQKGVLNQIKAFKEHMRYTHETAPMFLTVSHFSEEHIKGLYALADAFVLPSRGEGVGLPYIEALSSGLPVIATGWGGHMDFLNDGNAYFVDYELMPTRTKLEQGVAPNFNTLFDNTMMWAEPSVDSLRKIMRHVYENQEEAKAKGLQGRKDMETYTWDNAGLIMKQAIEKVLEAKA